MGHGSRAGWQLRMETHGGNTALVIWRHTDLVYISALAFPSHMPVADLLSFVRHSVLILEAEVVVETCISWDHYSED